jgi:hypothetical protein
MKFRGLIIALVVLGALGGVLYWSQNRKPPEGAVPASTGPVILRVNVAAVNQVTIKGKTPVTLERTQSGKWQITQPNPYPTDQVAVMSILSTLSGVNADRVVEDKASDRKPYGLDPPGVEVDIRSTGRPAQQLLLGDETPAGGNVYAALAGDPRVFTIASFSKSSLDKGLNDFRDKSLMTLSPDKVSRVELLRKPQEIEFDRTKDGWQILKPSSSPADSSAVNELVRSVTSARMDLSGTGTTDAAAEFARATPVATAKLTGDAGTQTLEVRKNKDDYYAKSSVVDGAYKVDSTLGQALDKKLEDFQSKKK